MIKFIKRTEFALLGKEYIDENIKKGALIAIGTDELIAGEELQEAIKKLKVVTVLDRDGFKYFRREEALQQRTKGLLYLVGDCFVEAEYFTECLHRGDIVQCEECGEYLFASDSVKTETGLTLCLHCADRSYRKCDECGKWYPKALVNKAGDSYYCPQCIINHAFYCQHCGTWHPFDEQHDVYVRQGSTIEHWCTACINTWARECSECHRYVIASDIDESGRCRSCRHNHDEDDLIYGESRIHTAMYHPSPRFFGSTEDERIAGLFFGVELETDKGNPEAYAEALRDIPEVYCKHDGSLANGVEVVTQPCTLSHHMDTDMWDRIAKLGLQNEMRSHDTTTCGFHIHISRVPFVREGVQDYEAKIAVAFEKFWKEWIVFSRRKPESIARWASRYGVFTVDELRRVLPGVSETHYCSSRYHSVNTTNATTVEVRIFRGTLKPETIKATIWAVGNIAERILKGFNPESATAFRELFDIENAPECFKEYLESKNL